MEKTRQESLFHPFLQKLGEALAENKTLTLLNVESNYISADGIIQIIEGMNKHQNIQELRVSNQVFPLVSQIVSTGQCCQVNFCFSEY